ncbi:MAG: GNAT family N-acetyltransferase [Anaerofustis sp.]
MEHLKQFHSVDCRTKKGLITVMGPISFDQLKQYDFDKGLTSFRKPQEQYQAVLEISQLPEGRIVAAIYDNTIVGYATFLYPDPLERWAEGDIENLLELGAIEVSNQFRGLSLGAKLLQTAMMDANMEDYIVMTTEYYWHWDLKNSGMDAWQYRSMMEKMMACGGLIWFATDDEEISSNPVNCLMVRIGKNVDMATREQFDKLRFQYRFMY